MFGTVFFETLRRSWRSTLYWGLGIASYGLIAILILPNQEALQGYVSLMASMPNVLMQAFGLEDVSLIGTPQGFLGYSYFLYMVLVICAYAVLMGLNITANEEDTGVLDMVVGLPVNRWQIVVEKFAAYSLLMLVIIMIGAAALMLGRAINVEAQAVSNSTLLINSLNMFPSGLLVLGFTALISVIVRRRSTAAALSAAFVVGSYLLDVLGGLVNNEVGDALRSMSFIRHYDAMHALMSGIAWVSFFGLTIIALLMLIGAVAFFQRRDIGV